MKWIKHDTDANQDAKLQNVLLDYGLEGYGLYWYCIELIAGKVDQDNITFELEHDARIIARNVGCTPEKVEQMMKYFVKAGLFESSGGMITCFKIARRLDKSMTSNPQMREIIEKLRSHDSVMIESAKPMQDKIRLDKSRTIGDKSPSINSSTVIEVYHSALPMLSRVQIVNDKRKASIRNFFKRRSSEKGEQFTIENFESYLNYIKSNCQWMLQANPKSGGGFYKPRDFDFIMTDRCYIAVKEQRFDNMEG